MIFFTADTHFGHKAILKYTNRPYSNTYEMDEAIINIWNTWVGTNDQVYHLGDFAFCSKYKALKILQRLNGRIHLIRGNHDRGPIKGPLKEAFEEVIDYKEINVALNIRLRENQKICMSHYAMVTWNKAHYGSWMLHGHSHGGLLASHPDHPGPKRLDVGWDVWGKPVNFDELKLCMKNRAFEQVDHHTPKE